MELPGAAVFIADRKPGECLKEQTIETFSSLAHYGQVYPSLVVGLSLMWTLVPSNGYLDCLDSQSSSQ